MKVLGIQFAPINIPLDRRLQTIGVFMVTFFMGYLALFGPIFFLYLLFYPIFWPFIYIYLIWILIVDRKTPERGGRASDWVRSWSIFKYAIDYFPIELTMKFEPELNKNYMFCSFPHGAIPTGPVITFLSKTYKGKVLFPNHESYGFTLNGNFKIPFYREYLLSMGICSASSESINYLLQKGGRGKLLGLVIGGAAEAFYCGEKNYHIVLRNRKGFVKLALKNGCSLVPLFSFGESRLFKQVVFPEDTKIRRFQRWFKDNMGNAPIFIHGRGFFQYSFGIVPFRNAINVVVGYPIDVPKVENPTQQDIDSLHCKFIEGLTDIFNKYKSQYEEDPENCSLIIT